MRRVDGNTLAGRNLEPTVRRAAAGEDQGMHMVSLNYRNLEIAVIWRRQYRFPHRLIVHC